MCKLRKYRFRKITGVLFNNKSATIAENDMDEQLERPLGAEQPADQGTKIGNHRSLTVLLWLIVAVTNAVTNAAHLVFLELGH